MVFRGTVSCFPLRLHPGHSLTRTLGQYSRLKNHQERYCPERAEREPQGLHEVEFADTDDPPAS